MKRSIITSLLIVIVILGILPFFLTPQAKESLSVGAGLVGSLASLVTLLIALSLYSKYGVEKSVLDKQTETVLRLLGELKKVRFLCEWEGGMLQLKLDRLQNKFWNDYKYKKLLFDGGYAEGLNSIWEIADDIFLPVEISKKFDALRVQAILGNQKGDGYMNVEVPGYFHRTKENHFFGLLNGKQITVEEFVGLWNEVITVTKKWLKDHSNTSVDLNFETK